MKIKLVNNLYVLIPVLILGFCFMILLYYNNYFETYDNRLFWGVIPFGLPLIPISVIYIQYLKEDLGKTVTMNLDCLHVEKNQREKIIKFSDIIKAQKFKVNVGSKTFFLQFFHFYRITSTNGDCIIITCLITRNIRIKNIVFENKDCILPIIRHSTQINSTQKETT